MGTYKKCSPKVAGATINIQSFHKVNQKCSKTKMDGWTIELLLGAENLQQYVINSLLQQNMCGKPLF